MITYDLNRPGQKYESLYEAIRELSERVLHAVDSTWIVQTKLNAVQIREALRPHIDSNDKLIVMRLADEWAALGLTDEEFAWLQGQIP